MPDEPNAPMTPREYVEAIVLPTLRDALAARDDRRRAYLACLVVCHVADSLGMAEAGAAAGFEALSDTARKKAVRKTMEAVQTASRDRCAAAFDVVLGFANGLKHPDKLPLLPGREESVPAFALDTPGAGADEGRIDVPGLALHVDGEVLFLDACAQQVLAAFVCAYPAHLGGIALSSFVDRGLPVLGLDMETAWLGGIAAWADACPEVAEVWLFGSRAKGTARPDSDVDLGLVLVSGDPGHDWPLGNALSPSAGWRAALAAIVGRHVSLELFSRPGEPQGEDEATARAPAILLWRREG